MALNEAAAGTLLRTALYDEHKRLGGRMVPFAGYEMPVQYAGIVEVPNPVRQRPAMIAVQGPEALGRLEGVIGDEFVRSLRPRRCGETEWRRQTLFASRTGYTGEDGLELVIEAEAGPELWRTLLDVGVQPAGLGSRDTLRLEAALLLYGNDIDEETNPWEVGLDWVVSLEDAADFIGRDALIRLRDAGPRRTLVCLKAEARGIMRGHCDIFREGRPV